MQKRKKKKEKKKHTNTTIINLSMQSTKIIDKCIF